MKKIIFFILFTLLCIIKTVSQNSEYIPYVTEGVKFVNERLIVNNGDTSSVYYIYEIAAGVDSSYQFLEDNELIMVGEDAYCCKYYTYPASTIDNDSIISWISLKESALGNFYVYDNEAYWKIVQEGRNLTISPGVMGPIHLYDFLYSYVNLYNEALFRYVYVQPDPKALKAENFIEVDSIQVDGMQMQRIAYIDDSGNIIAYIVQGIGFDSYDMGDLLTPFTRQPDHDADYQEWCGLSHVVKDGQIIYKGMRYRHGAFTGIEEAVADRTSRPQDPRYYDLTGRIVGTEVPTTPGIYIHQGKKIAIR